jgi:hypothetical protein
MAKHSKEIRILKEFASSPSPDVTAYLLASGAILAAPSLAGLRCLRDLDETTGLRKAFEAEPNATLRANLLQPLDEAIRIINNEYWTKQAQKEASK